MTISILHAGAAFTAAVTIASVGYCALSIVAALKCRRSGSLPTSVLNQTPAISVLKPLKGADPSMYEAFRSHCTQDYPEYELLFGITNENDPAAALVQRLVAEYPQRKIRLVLCDKRLGANGKVSSLVQLAASAKYDLLLVNDSDIRVEPDYLKTVVSELLTANVGMVTSLYRGVPENTFGSKLEALGIATDFVPGVLSAWLLEGGLHFGLGSTLAFRRSDLEKIGGFEGVLDYLADDYELGRRIAEHKLKIELSRSIVETHLPDYDFAGFFSHQLRWARTIRASRPGGYAGLLITFTLPWALLSLLLGGGTAGFWLIAVIAFVFRFTMAWVCAGSVLSDKHSLRLLWLLPLRDMLAAGVWMAGLLGRKIVWRGEVFDLERGKLKPAVR